VWAIPNMPANVAKYGKAIAAAVVGGLGALTTALAAGAGLDAASAITIVIAVLGGLGLTAVVPNAAKSDSQRIEEAVAVTGVPVSKDTKLEDVVVPAEPVVVVATPADVEGESADQDVEETVPEDEPYEDLDDVVVEDIDEEKLS
jgi:hypothetical protein